MRDEARVLFPGLRGWRLRRDAFCRDVGAPGKSADQRTRLDDSERFKNRWVAAWRELRQELEFRQGRIHCDKKKLWGIRWAVILSEAKDPRSFVRLQQ